MDILCRHHVPRSRRNRRPGSALVSPPAVSSLTYPQWFFAWRVWSVSKRYYLAIPPATISLFRCSLAFFIAIKFGTIGEEGFKEHYQWSFLTAQALNTIVRIIIVHIRTECLI
jgi:hypothetical protein